MELFDVAMFLDLRNHILIDGNSGYSYENKIHLMINHNDSLRKYEWQL